MARTGRRPYRRARAQVLAASDLCGICGHPGARQTNHRIASVTVGYDPRYDAAEYLEPAHGGGDPATGRDNPCPTCGRRCNQSLGATQPANTYRSRDW